MVTEAGELLSQLIQALGDSSEVLLDPTQKLKSRLAWIPPPSYLRQCLSCRKPTPCFPYGRNIDSAPRSDGEGFLFGCSFTSVCPRRRLLS